MGDVDMLGQATKVLQSTTLGDQGDGVCERVAREVLEAAGVLGADAQPPAVHQDGEPSMHDLVADWLWSVTGARGFAVERGRTKLLERKAFGLAKYGTTLQIGGPRDPASDLTDELIDALVYAQQGLERALRDGAGIGLVTWWRIRRLTVGRELLALMEGAPS